MPFSEWKWVRNDANCCLCRELLKKLQVAGGCATKPTFAMVFKLKSSCWILFCTFWNSASVWSSPLCWWGPGKTLTQWLCFSVLCIFALGGLCSPSAFLAVCFPSCVCVCVWESHLGKPHSCASPSWDLLAADASSAWCSAPPAPSGPDGRCPACRARMPLEPCTVECSVSAFDTHKTN